MSEQLWIDRAQAAVGDADTIEAAARFQPRGTSAGLVGGSGVGDAVGQLVGGDIGSAIGGIVGEVAGVEAAKHTEGFRGDHGGSVQQVPWQSVVAVSASRLYAWRLRRDGVHGAVGDPIFALDRDQVAVTVHSRVGVHTFEVEDLTTGTKWEFEATRLGSHLKLVTDALHDHPREPA